MHWTQHLAAWWIDYFAAASVLLAVVLLVGWLVRQPVQRMALAWSATIALVVLAVCCAAPAWPRISLIAALSEPAQTTIQPTRPIAMEVNEQKRPMLTWTIPTVPSNATPSAPKSPAGDVTKAKAPIAATPPVRTETSTKAIDFSSLLAAALLSGAVLVSAWLLLGHLRAAAIRRRAVVAPEFAQEELRSIVGSSRPLPKLLVDKLLSTAAAMGLWRPTILLPAAACEPHCSPLAPREACVSRSKTPTLPLRALLAHEYAHIERRDLWLLALGRVLLIILFAHPLYWFLRRRIRTDQELLADAAAAQHCGRHEYAETLVAWARHQQTPSSRLNWALGIWERPSQLSRRIAMLLNERIRLRLACSRWWQIGNLCVTIGMAVTLSLFSFNSTSRVTAAPATDSKTASSTEVTEVPSGDLLQLARKRIEDNYSELRTVQGTLEQVTLNPPQIEKKTTTELDSGASVTVTSTEGAYWVGRQILTLKGSDLRSESYRRLKDQWTHQGTTTRRGDVWTFFHPDEPWAEIKRTAEIGSFLPNDPRDFGGRDQRYGLLEQMRRSRVTEVISREPVLRVRTEIVDVPEYGYHKGAQFTYTLDPQKNYLPLMIIEHRDNGNIGILMEFSYDEVIPNKAWFMRQMTIKYFGEKGVTEVDSDAWTQILTVRVVGNLRINELVGDDVLEVKFPKGTRVVSQAGNKPMPSAEPKIKHAENVPATASDPTSKATVPKVTISGTVLDEKRKPIAGAHVWLFRIDHGGKNYTKPHGRMKWVQTMLPVPEASKESPLSYSGNLGSPDSQRLLEEVRTDENGKYVFSKVLADDAWQKHQATMLVVVQAAGRATEFHQPVVSNHLEREQEKLWVEPAKIELEPAETLSGRITNADGKPVAGALVSPCDVNHLPKPMPGIACAITDADGRYEINDLKLFDVDDFPPMVMEFGAIKMATLAVSVDHPDYAQGIIEYTKVPANIDHVLQRPAKLTGKVVFGDSDQAAEKTYVRWTHENGLSAGDFTDAEGRYSFEKLLPGKYTVAAERNDRLVNSQEITLSPGDNALECRLQLGGIVKGRVVDDATGKVPQLNRGMSIQVAAINVARVKNGKENEPKCQGYVQNDGTFSMAVHPGQNLFLFVNPQFQIADAQRWAKQGIEIAEGKTVEVELRVKPRTGGWNAMFNEAGAMIAQIKGEPAPTPLPASPAIHSDLGDGGEEAMLKAFVDWPADLLPKKPMSEKSLRMMLENIDNFGEVEKKTIDGEEQITSVMLGACSPVFDSQLVGQIIWLEHSLLAHIDKFPHLESLMMMGVVGDDDWLKPLRGNKTLKMVGFPYAKQITAAGIEHLSTLPNLEGMYLMSMRFDVDALAKINEFPKLTALQLGGNVTDELLAHLQGNTKLTQLSAMVLGKRKLTDEGLQHIASLPNLEEFAIHFEFADAGFTDDGLKHFAAATKLHSLTIGGKQITDAGLVHLYELSNLKTLNVEETSVTQQGLDELQKRLPGLKIKTRKNSNEPRQTATQPDSTSSPTYRPGTIGR